MAQKKAFVRYANNKAVPGSLIVRTKAPKVGTWKEVPYDVCCGGGGCDFPPVTLTYNISQVDFSQTLYFYLICNNATRLYNEITPAESITPQQYVDYLNLTFGWTGTFTLNGDIVTYEINGNFANLACPDGELTFLISNPAIP